MNWIVVSMEGVWLLEGSVFFALEMASTEPSQSGVSRRKENNKRTDWGEVGCPPMLSQH